MSAVLRPLICLAVSAVLGLAAVSTVSAAEPAGRDQAKPRAPRAELRPPRAAEPPSIDGVLDDEVWRSGPLETGEWLSYNPLHGTAIPQKTKTWIAYDADYLYFAFQCDDPEPSQIKTSITRRDNIWSDDWVGLSLDALGTGQLSYHLLVNPSGVQLDMLNSASGGEDDLARLRLGQRRAPERHRLCRRDPAAAADDPVSRWRRRAHGDPVLAPRQPRRDVGVLAGAQARHLGVRAACVAAVQRPPGPARARGHPVGDLRAKRVARHAVTAGARRTTRATSG